MSETTTEAVQDNVQEVATQSQNEEPTSPEVGNLIAESKKYRSRAQEAESQLAELRASLEKKKEEELAEQNKWEELANKRQSELDSMKSDYERLKTEFEVVLKINQEDVQKKMDKALGRAKISEDMQ